MTIAIRAIIIIFIIPVCAFGSSIHLDAGSIQISQPIETWTSRRDQQIVKQQFDFSCGASSMATLLTHYFNDTHTEIDILELFDHKEAAASFDDMKNVLTTLGYQAKGYAVSFAQLAKVTVPVILHIHQKETDHFVVLRAIDDEHVHVADPSTGNRFYSKQQFLKLWLTDTSSTKGKILAVMGSSHGDNTENFFLNVVKYKTPIIFPPFNS